MQSSSSEHFSSGPSAASESEPAEAAAKKSSDSSNPDEAVGQIELLGLAMSLRDLSQRLLSLEGKLEKRRESGSYIGSGFIELAKVVFGGWPALGLLFLILFYEPLREALNAIPAKVKGAQEIAVLGVSLKSSIQVEAAKLGASGLSETIPRLSSSAIELLLRAPKASESLISYTPGDQQAYVVIHFPSVSTIDVLSELQLQGLISIANEKTEVTGSGVRQIIDEFRKAHPGLEEQSFVTGRMAWKPNVPLPKEAKIPRLTWELTDLGKKAVEIILKAVSSELAPKPSPAPSR